MSDLSFVAGDTAPSITGTLTNISEADLAAASAVRFQMRLLTEFRYTVDGVATVTSAAAKEVRYDWAAGDLDTPGDYASRWLVVFADTTLEHSIPANTITVEAA